MAPLELVQSEAAIATSEEGIIRAQPAVGDAEDVLRQLLNLPAGAALADADPADHRPGHRPRPDQLDEAIEAALASRPELKRQELAITQASSSSEYAHGQLKPSWTSALATTRAGTGGNLDRARPGHRQVSGAVIPGGYGDCLQPGHRASTSAAGRPSSFSATRSRTAPPGAERQRQHRRRPRRRRSTTSCGQSIDTEVRRPPARVDTAAKSIDAARKAREFQEKNLDAEKKSTRTACPPASRSPDPGT